MERIKKISKYRTIILILMDTLCITIAYYLGAILTTDTTLFEVSHYYAYRISRTVIISVIIYQLVFQFAQGYKSIIRYEEGKDYLKYFGLSMLSSIIVCVIRKTFGLHIATPKLIILAGVFISFLMISYRIIARYILVSDLVNKGINIKKKNKCYQITTTRYTYFPPKTNP